jgi:hypothetical protein
MKYLISFACLFLVLPVVAQTQCANYQGRWLYKGSPEDGFENLTLKITCDSLAPLPQEYLQWAGIENLLLRGHLEFDVDSYLMGPFPFASIASEADRLQTHYFYQYMGQPSYQYEDFDLKLSEDKMILNLWDIEECAAGPCEVLYPFSRINEDSRE